MNGTHSPRVVDDAEIETDRAFFARWPARTCRLRYIGRAEKAEVMERGELAQPPPGYVGCVAVLQVKPGVRIRVFFLAVAGTDMRASDEVALATWRDFADENAKRLLSLVQQPGNAPLQPEGAA